MQDNEIIYRINCTQEEYEFIENIKKKMQQD